MSSQLACGPFTLVSELHADNQSQVRSFLKSSGTILEMPLIADLQYNLNYFIAIKGGDSTLDLPIHTMQSNRQGTVTIH